MIRLLMIGDVMGRPGRTALASVVPNLRKTNAVDVVIANGENAAAGFGIQPKQVEEFYRSGVDVITLGNHAWDKKEIVDYIEKDPRLLRPLNYPEGVPGRGSCVVEVPGKGKVGVINVMGRVYMPNLDDPFRTTKREVERLKKECKVVLVDHHAEVTSEKIAMGWHLDGVASAVVGTHTHVQTADERVLPGGTAYITDVGMTGGHDGVIGVRREIILKRFLTQMPIKFEITDGDVQLNGALIDVDEATGHAVSISRVREHLSDLLLAEMMKGKGKGED